MPSESYTRGADKADADNYIPSDGDSARHPPHMHVVALLVPSKYSTDDASTCTMLVGVVPKSRCVQ